MDHDEYFEEFWQRWLTQIIGEIVNKNLIKLRGELDGYVSQGTGSFDADS
jgi:hypothetical protein